MYLYHVYQRTKEDTSLLPHHYPWIYILKRFIYFSFWNWTNSQSELSIRIQSRTRLYRIQRKTRISKIQRRNRISRIQRRNRISRIQRRNRIYRILRRTRISRIPDAAPSWYWRCCSFKTAFHISGAARRSSQTYDPEAETQPEDEHEAP